MAYGVVYKITNKESGMVYIGRTKNIKERITNHISSSRKQKTRLQRELFDARERNALFDVFTFSEICTCDDLPSLREAEKEEIRNHAVDYQLYNRNINTPNHLLSREKLIYKVVRLEKVNDKLFARLKKLKKQNREFKYKVLFPWSKKKLLNIYLNRTAK